MSVGGRSTPAAFPKWRSPWLAKCWLAMDRPFRPVWHGYPGVSQDTPFLAVYTAENADPESPGSP